MTTLSIDDAAWASPWRRRRVGEKVLLSLALPAVAAHRLQPLGTEPATALLERVVAGVALP